MFNRVLYIAVAPSLAHSVPMQFDWLGGTVPCKLNMNCHTKKFVYNNMMVA